MPAIGLLTQPGKLTSEVQQELPTLPGDGIQRKHSQTHVLCENGVIAANYVVPYVRRGESILMPARTQKAQEKDAPASEGGSRDYLETTRQFWQPYAERTLSREDAREMAHNLLGFFAVLREWTIAERERAKRGILPPYQKPQGRKRGRPRKNASAERDICN